MELWPWGKWKDWSIHELGSYTHCWAYLLSKWKLLFFKVMVAIKSIFLSKVKSLTKLCVLAPKHERMMFSVQRWVIERFSFFLFSFFKLTEALIFSFAVFLEVAEPFKLSKTIQLEGNPSAWETSVHDLSTETSLKMRFSGVGSVYLWQIHQFIKRILYTHVIKGSVYVKIYAYIFVQDQKFLLEMVIFRSITCTSFRKIQPTDSYSCEEIYRDEEGIRV